MSKKEIILNNILIAMRIKISKNELQMLEQVIIKELYNVEIIERETLPATVDNTNNYIMELFMAKKAPKLSEQTVEQYINAVKNLVTTVNKPILSITNMDIEYFLQSHKRKGNSNVSINNIRRNLSAFFTWMRKSKLILDNPCEQIDPWKETDKPIDHMEPEETEQLKNGCINKRDRALLEFLRCTAMRREEIPCVKISDINWNNGKIVIYGQKTNAYRLVCLDSVGIHYIKEYIAERGIQCNSNEPLFTHLRGDKRKVLEKDGVYNAVKNIGKRANMERRIYPHLFRKTVATNVIKRGGSEEAAGEYLGHKPRTVTGRHYAYKSDDYIMEIFKRYVATI